MKRRSIDLPTGVELKLGRSICSQVYHRINGAGQLQQLVTRLSIDLLEHGVALTA